MPFNVMMTPLSLNDVLNVAFANGYNKLVESWIVKLWEQNFFPHYNDPGMGNSAFINLASLFNSFIHNATITNTTIHKADLAIITIDFWLKIYGKILKKDIPLNGQKAKSRDICVKLKNYVIDAGFGNTAEMYRVYDIIEKYNRKYVCNLYSWNLL